MASPPDPLPESAAPHDDLDTSDEEYVIDGNGSDNASVSPDSDSSSEEGGSSSGSNKNPKSRKTKRSSVQRRTHDERKKDDVEGDSLLSDTDEVGGHTGVLTRSRRRQLAEEAANRPSTIPSNYTPTVDVSAIWNRIQTGSVDFHGRGLEDSGITSNENPLFENRARSDGAGVDSNASSSRKYEDEYITIRRVFEFAGQTQSEEKRVLRSSAEAQVYLSSLANSKDGKSNRKSNGVSKQSSQADGTTEAGDANASSAASALGEQPDSQNGFPFLADSSTKDVQSKHLKNRPLKRLSRFDPNPIGIVRTLPPELQLRWPREPTFTALLQQYQAQAMPGQGPIIGPRRGRGGGMTVFSTRGRGRGRGAGVGLHSSQGGRGGAIGGNLMPPHIHTPGHAGLVSNTPYAGAPGGDYTNSPAVLNPFSGLVAMPAGYRSAAPAQKLNTIEKSRYDWAGFVDESGIADELDRYGKAKESYLGRTHFLVEAEMRQEELRKQVRKGAGEKGAAGFNGGRTGG